MKAINFQFSAINEKFSRKAIANRSGDNQQIQADGVFAFSFFQYHFKIRHMEKSYLAENSIHYKFLFVGQ